MKEHEDDYFRKLMTSSRLEMPFEDFEEELMSEIARREEQRESLAGNVKLSWIFFLAGTLFGGMITLLLPSVPIPLPGLASELLVTAFQVFFALFVFMQGEKLVKLTQKSRGRAIDPG